MESAASWVRPELVYNHVTFGNQSKRVDGLHISINEWPNWVFEFTISVASALRDNLLPMITAKMNLFACQTDLGIMTISWCL
jgi:hypothetical protein